MDCAIRVSKWSIKIREIVEDGHFYLFPFNGVMEERMRRLILKTNLKNELWSIFNDGSDLFK